MFYDHYRNYHRYYPYYDYYYYPYRPIDWYNPYSPFYDNYLTANVDQNITNTGSMQDVHQNAYINQSVSRPHSRKKSRK